MKRLAVLLVAAALASSASAQLPPLVKSAFDALDHDPGKWAYTQTTVEEGTKTVETYDPSKPAGQQYHLLLKNGHAPSASELAEYSKEKAAREERRSRAGAKTKGTRADLQSVIRPGSVRLIRESAVDASYEFALPLAGKATDAEREMVDAMKGRLTVVKNGPWLQVLEIDNVKPINPAPTVKIERMYTKTTFRPPAPGLPPLLAEVRTTVRGRVLFVKKLDTDSIVTYSDYRQVGPSH